MFSGGSDSSLPRLRLSHLNVNKYGRAEDGEAAVLDSLKSPVVHHIPIILEDDFFSDSRDTECYADRLRSLKIQTDISSQKERGVGRRSSYQSHSFENRIKDSSKRPTIHVDTFKKPSQILPKQSVQTSGSKIYIQREKIPEPTCPLHGWKSNHQNAVHSNKVTDARARLKDSKRQNTGFGSLRVKKHSLDSKLSNTTENPFQRRWSLRVPESSSSQMIFDDDSLKAPTLSSISRSNIGFLAEIPDYFKERKNVRSDEKSESIHDHFSALNRESRVKRSTTSTSLNSFHPTKVLFELLSASLHPPFLPASIQRSGCISKLIFTCVQNFLSQASPSNFGILKSPGKRRVSSSNRVDFLDNLQEKEIPCRQT